MNIVNTDVYENGELEFYGGKLKNIERLKGILSKSKELKFSVMELAESERLDKSKNLYNEPLIPNFVYPSMKRCHVADLETRRIYKEMCEYQYNTLNRYIVSYNEKLFNAGLIKQFDEKRYVLTWPKYENFFN